MSDWYADRTSSLLRLRRAQSRVVTRLVPDIASEPGAVATPSLLQLDGPRGGRHVGQRVCVERAAATFDAVAAFAAADEEWNAAGDACRLLAPKRDGALRLDLTTRSGEFHSITLLHGGRVLQLTSFSDELGVAAPEDGAEPPAGASGDAEPTASGPTASGLDDDPLSADTLAEPPEFSPEELRAAADADAAARHAAARDPRPDHLVAEEREHGPDYGYRLRTSR